jgi:hypothetical protein
MARLIEVRFTAYTAYLKPCGENVRRVVPDVAGREGQLLGQAIHRATGERPQYWQDTTWMVPIEKLTPDVCRRILHTFQQLLLEEQRRLSGLAEALGDPRPAPEPDETEDEAAEAEIRMPPDQEEELRRFREEVDRMVAKWEQDRGGNGA